jgi:hypothetical protein
MHFASTLAGRPMAEKSTPVLFPVRDSHPVFTCNIYFLRQIFKLAEMGKNIEFIPVFILQVLYLANPWPDDRPQ